MKDNNRRYGAYTTAKWAPDNKYATDSQAFVFSLDYKEHYPIIDPTKAIYRYTGGP